MHRPNLNALPPAERSLLAQYIQRYVTPAIVAEHWNAVLSGVHQDPVSFLSFHRNYIAGLENFLVEQGHPEWNPLPAWNPREPIPEEFNIPNSGPGRLRNLNPNVSFSPEFDQENLANFSTTAELGRALMERHNLVHSRIGGIMNNLQTAPQAPIFWPFHSFIDDIWWNWQRITVAVPSCLGLTLREARQLLGSCGLEISMPRQSVHFMLFGRIRFQNPYPDTLVPRGTVVKLF